MTDGDLIVCTTHQLYRYYQAFDLLILDEPDAFPFRGNPVLHGIAKTSCKGHVIYLTATPDDALDRRVKKGDLCCLSLDQRPHGRPIPVPKVKTGPKWLLLLCLLHWIKKQMRHPRMVFAPTIAMARGLGLFLSFLRRM
jgi:competence protein ComFA